MELPGRRGALSQIKPRREEGSLFPGMAPCFVSQRMILRRSSLRTMGSLGPAARCPPGKLHTGSLHRLNLVEPLSHLET